MKINNISRIVILLALVANVIAGCRFEEEDLFETSANLRQEYANREIKKILCSASENGGHGWVFQYFVAGNDDAKYPGYNMYCNFYESGKVVIGSDHPYILGGTQGKYSESASFYEMKKDEANTLAFTTWNDVLTPFVNPDASGEGMHGDCDLIVMSWDENEITFRGTRHSARSRLVRLDCPIEQYMEETKAMKDLLNGAVKTFYVINGTDTIYVKDFVTGRPTYCERLIDPLEQKTISCVFTPTGYRTEYAEEIMGENIQEFKINEEKSALVADDCDVKVVPMWDDYIINHTAIWEIDTDKLSAEQKTLFDQINAEVKKYNANWSLKSFGLGQTTGSEKVIGLVLTFYTNAAKSKTNTAGVALTIKRAGYGKVAIDSNMDSKGDKNLSTLNNKAPELSELAHKAAMTFNGKYTMSTENYFVPTSATFTADGSGNTFTCGKAE